MEIFNSPLVVLLFFALIGIVILVRKMTGADKRCGECGSGKMEEVQAKPEGLLGDTTANSTAKTSVRYLVTYKCANCKATFTRSESRD